MSAPKCRFIFYNSFSLGLTENLHVQNIFSKHDLHVLVISKMDNKIFYFSPYDPLKVTDGTAVIRSFLVHFKKINPITIKIEPVTCIWMFVYAMNFELPEMAKKWSLGLFRPNLPPWGLFHQYFVCKSSFRVISMINIVILDQSKPISLYLKIKNWKCKNAKSVNFTFIIHKNRIMTSIQPILKSNSTSFMLNNIFYEMKRKKVIHCGGDWGEPSKLLLGSVISVFT